jgi:hypothetical protein
MIIGLNVHKAWEFYKVTHSTWITFESFLGCLRSVGMLATLIANVELWRGDSMEECELSTCLGLEDYADRKIAT